VTSPNYYSPTIVSVSINLHKYTSKWKSLTRLNLGSDLNLLWGKKERNVEKVVIWNERKEK
jgi:hypothetical protein